MLRILLEHPGGLRFEEFWKIVESQKICAKGTFNKRLKELVEEGLIAKDALNHYTLGLTQPMAQKIMESGYKLPEKAESFLEVLYMTYEQDVKKETGVYAEIGIRYLLNEQRNLLSWTWLLFPFLFDKKIRELWFIGHANALNFLFEKLDEISKRFLGVKLSRAFSTKSVIEEHMVPQIETLIEQIKLENGKIIELVDQLDIPNDQKEKIKQQIKSI
jgi:DNA-binding HxlR family transcriptional regulator